MADFAQAYEKTMKAEGGYVLHHVAGDRGGQTYAGISRVHNPSWPGWQHIDRGDTPPTPLVRDFYRQRFWDLIKGDKIVHQQTAESIYDFAVNAGSAVAIKLAQTVVGAAPDGVIGPKTLAALNAYDPDRFALAYALAKLSRYREIVRRDRTQSKFLFGWLNRTLDQLA